MKSRSPLVPDKNAHEYLEEAFFGTDALIGAIRSTEDHGSYYTARQHLLQHLELALFPKEIWDQVLRMKDYLLAEMRMSKTYTWKDDLGARRITLFELVVHKGQIPNQLLDTGQHDFAADILNASKLHHLDRFFFNRGRVFHSQVEEATTAIDRPTRTNLLTNINIYEELKFDGVLRRAEEEELPLVLHYFKKQRMVDGLFSLGRYDYQSLASKSKSDLIRLMMKEHEIQSLRLWESFYVLSDDYQQLKEWIEVENVYLTIAETIIMEVDMAMLFLPDIINRLRNTCHDLKTAVKILDLYDKNIHRLSTNGYIVAERMKKEKRLLDKALRNQ